MGIMNFMFSFTGVLTIIGAGMLGIFLLSYFSKKKVVKQNARSHVRQKGKKEEQRGLTGAARGLSRSIASSFRITWLGEQLSQQKMEVVEEDEEEEETHHDEAQKKHD